MGQYIVLAILVVIVFSFIFGENIFKSSWIPFSIKSSLLVVGSIVFYSISGYCFYTCFISNEINNKYLYIGVGSFLILLTTVIMIRGIKNIRIHLEDVDTNAKEADTILIKETNNNFIGQIGSVMIISSIILIIAVVSFLYL